MAGEDPRVTIRLPPKLLEKLSEEVEARGLRWDQRGDIEGLGQDLGTGSQRASLKNKSGEGSQARSKALG